MRVRSSLPLLAAPALLLFASAAWAQTEVIIVAHRNDGLISRIDEPTNTFLSSGPGKAGILDIITLPTPTAPQILYLLTATGKVQTANTTLANFTNLPLLGPATGMGYANGAGFVKNHLPVVGVLTGNNTSTNFLELKSVENDGSLDAFVSSSLVSNWVDVAFISNGVSYAKYAIADLQYTLAPSSVVIMDVSQYRMTSGNPLIDPGFDPNNNEFGPPYTSLPTQMAAQPAGVITQWPLAADGEMHLEVYTNPTGNKYFVLGTTVWDCSPAPGIQFGLGVVVYNPTISLPQNTPAVAAMNCFGYISNVPTIKDFKVYGNFAFITEAIGPLGNGAYTGRIHIINLREWETPARNWAGTPTVTAVPFTLTGSDAIGANMNRTKVYVGTMDEPFGIVYMIPVNVTRTAGSAMTGAQANITLMTPLEQDMINPPSRIYPGAYSAVNEGNDNIYAAFGGGGGDGGCSAGSSRPAVLPAALLAALLSLAAAAALLSTKMR